MSIFRRVILSALSVLCFTTLAANGQNATTQVATAVTDIAATLNGSVTPGSTSVYSYCWFEYGTDTTYGTSVNADNFSVIGTTPIAVAANPQGLLPNTTYHYRVVLGLFPYNDNNPGDDMTFTTGPPATLPSFQSVNTDIISDTIASFDVWSAMSGGSNTNVSIEYGADTTYGSVFTSPNTMAANTTASIQYCNITGLQPSTTYHWRLRLTNGQGSVYSADSTFTTLATPVITTSAASGVTYTTANLSGSVNPAGHNLLLTFVYGWIGYNVDINGNPYVVSGAGSNTVSASIGGLRPGTTYSYYLSAFDLTTGQTYNGPVQTFATQVPQPVTTTAATNVTDLNATLNGSVYLGPDILTSVNFEIGTTTSYETVIQGTYV